MGLSAISVLKFLRPQISFVAKYLIQAPIRKELGNQRLANNGEGNEQIAEIIRILPQFRVSTTAQPPIDPVCDCKRPNSTRGELAISRAVVIMCIKVNLAADFVGDQGYIPRGSPERVGN